MWNIHITENYSAIKSSKAHSIMWTNLENILSEINQSQNTTYRLISLVDLWLPKANKLEGNRK